MVLRQTSDSLSRCDPGQYSNIYDLRRHSDFKADPVKPTFHKDTIEISRDKIKGEALQRLRHTTTSVVAHNSFIRIGKCLFVAIAFPPYLILYGLPKWILVEGIPALLSFFVEISKKIQQKTKKYVEAASQRLRQAVEFIQKLNQVLVQPVIRLALDIRHGIQRMRHQTVLLFKQIKKRMKFNVLSSHLNIPEQLKRLQKRIAAVKDKWTQQAHKISVQLQQNIQWIKLNPQNIVGWGQLQFQRLKEQTVAWKTVWERPLQASQQLAHQTTLWILKQAAKGVKSFKQTLIEPLQNFHRQHIQPFWKKLTEATQMKWSRTRHFFQHKHRKALSFLKEKQEKMKKLSQQQLMHKWLAKLPLNQQQWLKKWLFHPITQAFCKKIRNTYYFVTTLFLSIFQNLLQMIAKAIGSLFKSGTWLRDQAKRGGRRALDMLTIGQRVCCKLARQALYYALLGMMIGAILSVWSVRSLGVLMHSLTKSLSFTLLKPKI